MQMSDADSDARESEPITLGALELYIKRRDSGEVQLDPVMEEACKRVRATAAPLVKAMHGTLSLMPAYLNGSLLAAMNARMREMKAAIRTGLRLAPVRELVEMEINGSLPLDEFRECVRSLMAGWDCHSLDVEQVAWLLLMLRSDALNEDGRLYQDLIRKLQSQRARNPRNRRPSVWGCASLADAVRRESKKRAWSGAWSWLVQQSESRQTIGDFELIESDGGSVTYSHVPSGKTPLVVKKSTFRDNWNPSASGKKRAGKKADE